MNQYKPTWGDWVGGALGMIVLALGGIGGLLFTAWLTVHALIPLGLVLIDSFWEIVHILIAFLSVVGAVYLACLGGGLLYQLWKEGRIDKSLPVPLDKFYKR